MLDRVGQFTGDAADATKRGAASAALRAEVAILEGRLAALTKEEAALATRQTTANDVGATVARRRQLKEEMRATQAEIASKLAKVSALKRSKAEAAKTATTTARAAARRAACAGCLQFVAAVVLLLAAAAGAAYEFGLWEVPPSFFDRDRLLDGHVTRYERQTFLRALSAASLTAVAACVVALSTRRSGGALAAACCIVVLVAGGSDEAVDEARYGRLYEHKPALAAAVVLLVLVIGLGCCAAPSSRRDAVGSDVAPSAAALRNVGVAALGLLLLLALTLAQTPLGASLTARLPEEVSAYVQDGQDDEGPSYLRAVGHRAPRGCLDDPRLVLPLLWRLPVLLPREAAGGARCGDARQDDGLLLPHPAQGGAGRAGDARPPRLRRLRRGAQAVARKPRSEPGEGQGDGVSRSARRLRIRV